MQQFTHTISDPNGIHARPAGLLAQQMQAFKSTITIKKDEQSASAKQLIGIMKMRLKCGQTFTLTAEGEDETAAIDAAKAFLASNL
ncbi:HPr family phosphocarrier protein [Treponema primitia]|uniref:HPr family phosphocarrier protein n=1 Tax=Treponema primitia TaxID=88058 RepID=UPI000255531B|nr:HPr family phosphocarrier protein [Treponema primitia]